MVHDGTMPVQQGHHQEGETVTRQKPIKIRTKLKWAQDEKGFHLGGWLQGKQTYLWFGDANECFDILDGPKLLRLAKAIVRHMDRPQIVANGKE